MCFSVQVDVKLKALAKENDALINLGDFLGAKINAEKFDQLFENYKEEEIKREKLLEAGRKRLPRREFGLPDDEGRIYPFVFAPIITFEEGETIITPMRYQLLPHFCKEDRYKKGKQELKTFNARIDKLETAAAWSNVFMKKHGVIAIKSFYEWVPKPGQNNPAQIEFLPDNHEWMFVPVLWDRWQEKLDSFAIITDNPYKEILDKGHDRRPKTIKRDNIEYWIRPEEESREEIFELLNDEERIYFNSKFVS